MKAGKKMRAERYGRLAELAAGLFLQLKGYRILARRLRTPRGELDLVARRGSVLAFVEVKARQSHQRAFDAMTPQTQRRVAAAADMFVAARPAHANLDQRYDAILIWPWGLTHLKDAWRRDRLG